MAFYHDIETVPDWEKIARIGPKLELVKLMLDVPVSMLKVIEAGVEINSPEQWHWGKYAVDNIFPSTRNVVLGIKRGPALIPQLNKIRAIGTAVDNGQVHAGIVTPDNEKAVLAKFWQIATNNTPIVGYNCRNFDLPTLMWHSAKHGIEVPHIDSAPWKGLVVDIYHELRYTPMAMPMKTLALISGIDVPAEGVDGSMVESMSDEDVLTYQASDVEVTRKLYHLLRGGVFWK